MPSAHHGAWRLRPSASLSLLPRRYGGPGDGALITTSPPFGAVIPMENRESCLALHPGPGGQSTWTQGAECCVSPSDWGRADLLRVGSGEFVMTIPASRTSLSDQRCVSAPLALRASRNKRPSWFASEICRPSFSRSASGERRVRSSRSRASSAAAASGSGAGSSAAPVHPRATCGPAGMNSTPQSI